jgi:2,4-diketo-3-deoxy-L-fuconate hydrolase
MKLFRFGQQGQEKPGVFLSNGSGVDVSGSCSDYSEAFFASGGLDTLSRWLRANIPDLPKVDRAMRLGPPVSRPSKIVCIGHNYRDHVAETRAQVPKEPVVLLKSTTAMSGPNDDVVIPRNGLKVNSEVELAVVIGKQASYVSKENVFEFVAGYALFNDYSERSSQLERGGQWVKGKSADSFAPLGPFLASSGDVPNHGQLNLWLKVNGELRQKGNTSDYDFRRFSDRELRQ